MLGEISIPSDTQMTPPLWQKAKRELKSLLMKVMVMDREAWRAAIHRVTKSQT